VPDEAAEPVTYPRDAGQHLADLYRRERLAAFGGCFVPRPSIRHISTTS